MRRLSARAKKGKSNTSDSDSNDEEQQGNGNTTLTASDLDASDEEENTKSTKKNKRAKKSENNSVKANDGGEGADGKKRKKRNSTAVKTDDELEYEVEEVIDSKVHRGRRQFKIRWRGFGPEEDTWEPEEDLSCPELIQAYLDKHPEEDTKEGKDIKSKKPGGKASATSPSKKIRFSDDVKDYKGDEEDEDEDGDGNANEKVYEVEKVVEVHFKKNGKREFLIRWKGFASNDDTWEPEENLSCPDLIEKFMSRVDKAKSATARELRANPQHTDRFTLNMTQSGRRLSRRNSNKQRVTYHNYE